MYYLKKELTTRIHMYEVPKYKNLSWIQKVKTNTLFIPQRTIAYILVLKNLEEAPTLSILSEISLKFPVKVYLSMSFAVV